MAVDDFQQVLVGQHRRKLQNRAGDDQFRVPGQLPDDLGRSVGHVLQGFGKDLADPGDLVAGEDFQCLVGHPLDFVLFVGAEARRQLGDLSRQVAADVLVGVLGQHQIRLRRRHFVAGDQAAHLGGRVFG